MRILGTGVQEADGHISADTRGPRGVDLGDHHRTDLVSHSLLISGRLGGLGQQVQRRALLGRSQKLSQRQRLHLLGAPCQLLLVMITEKQRVGPLALRGIHGGGGQMGGQHRARRHQGRRMRHPQQHGVNRRLPRRNSGLRGRCWRHGDSGDYLSQRLHRRQRLRILLRGLHEPLAELPPGFVPAGRVLPGEPPHDRLREVAVEAMAHPPNGLRREHVLLRNRASVLHAHRRNPTRQLQGLLHRPQALQRLRGGLGAHVHEGALLQLDLGGSLVPLGNGAQSWGDLQAAPEQGDVLHGDHGLGDVRKLIGHLLTENLGLCCGITLLQAHGTQAPVAQGLSALRLLRRGALDRVPAEALTVAQREAGEGTVQRELLFADPGAKPIKTSRHPGQGHLGMGLYSLAQQRCHGGPRLGHRRIYLRRGGPCAAAPEQRSHVLQCGELTSSQGREDQERL
mmetsp:Transcript_50934/g.134214  ORF Transcript_50934/g.134214 Transcript_50934/m.134214 type:complete len:454 (-) Transcript_50934:192-1553(-)